MIHELPSGRIIRARVEDVYPTIPSGSVTLTISDGPYGLRIAEWDKVADLAAFYRPHIAEWSRISAPSASVYLWGTAEGWATVHPEMGRAGWTFRNLLVWDKLNTAGSMAYQKIMGWPVTHEVCGFYVRGDPPFTGVHPRSVWPVAVQGWADERLTTGEMRVGARNQDGVPCMVAEALHVSQKPLLFAHRMIEASSLPGSEVFVPFGGTCREAVACESIAHHWPERARRYVVVEQDEDGKDYIGAVLRQLRTGATRVPVATSQAPLFPTDRP